MSTESSNPRPASPYYEDPANPALGATGLQLDLSRAALVVIDPQIDFLSPEGVTWPLVGDSVTENGVVGHLGQLFEAAKKAGITVAVSPHYYYPCDHEWEHGGPLEKTMHEIGMFDRKSPLSLEGFENSGADFMPQYKPFILDGKTIICSPHKVYGPQTNDLTLQLRKKGVSQVILAGMAANLCVESHLRDLVEQGFEVIVVRDATAAPRIPEGDGYLAALINYRFIANALWTTEQVIEKLKG
ncbi:nicotinamidase-related amidase [Pseudomonas sp. JUb42]|jgi:nicotinamidase-related amidase|uniref:cysteine hydrolase family protein n=1 Tax=Pseudomonas sp. JUb42 TaxID=2940611 RepID=UPI002168DF5E|nr:cysteine hydrolase [Pseudomonas sp. JUb42]MCS3472066.1 nicotinamidase-related amidase [Pseudomonas sp. JUb42]